MARWAVFDVDGTLLPGTSMEERSLLHALSRNVIPLRNVGRCLLTALRQTAPGDSLKSNKMYPKGLAANDIQDHADSFFLRRIASAISSTGLAMFGEPVTVNPERELRRIAHQRGWPIEKWR